MYAKHYIMGAVESFELDPDLRFDFVFLTGRFRASAGIFATHLIHDKSYVAVYDYKNRRGYHILERYYNIVDQIGTLVILQKKSEEELPTPEEYDAHLHNMMRGSG